MYQRGLNNNGGFRLNRAPNPMTLRLIIINVIMWLAQIILGSRLGLDITNLLGLHYMPSEAFRVWQWFTYMFLHSTEGMSHLFFNMFALWMFGSTIERYWGSIRYLYFYLVCGITAALAQQLVWHLEFRDVMQYQMVELSPSVVLPVQQFLELPVTVGASGAVFGLLLAFGMLFPNHRVAVFPIPVALKAKYFVVIYALIELYMGLHPSVGSSVAHFAHLGGMLGGFILIVVWRKKGRIDGPYF